jgi:CheY-like chemotaxis protein
MKGADIECRDAGMDDYLSKPIDRTALLDCLGRWLPGATTVAVHEQAAKAT